MSHIRKTNRFVLEFPKEFNIEGFYVKSISPLVYDVPKSKWEDITILFYDSFNEPVSEKLVGLIDKIYTVNFMMSLSMLSPDGKVIESWYLTDCNIKSFDLGKTDYSLDKIKYPSMIVSVGKFIIDNVRNKE